MLDRGVLTSGGRRSDEGSKSEELGKTRLNEVELAFCGRTAKLRDVANSARQTAGGLQLGQNFDPYSYSSEADRGLRTSYQRWAIRYARGCPGSSLTLLDLPQSEALLREPGIRHLIRRRLQECSGKTILIQVTPAPRTRTLSSSLCDTHEGVV
jgi:hypothetical protein